jgi:hypothetical protein
VPDLIIEPEIGDNAHDCFDMALGGVFSGKYRVATFQFNGVEVTVKPQEKGDENGR